MALVKSVLENTLYTCFKSMQSDADFANGIASACSVYCSTATISTTDSGAIPGGAYLGKGTGQGIICVPSLASAIIIAATTLMPTLGNTADDYLAEQLGLALHTMVSAGVITCASVGTLTPPPPATPTPYAGTCVGSIKCSYASMVQGLKDCFAEMRKPQKEGDPPKDGDRTFAQKFADFFDSYLTSGSVITNGQGNLVGVTGTGSIK